MESDFLSPERASQEELDKDIRHLANLDLIWELAAVIPDLFLVLNSHRQIVFCNSQGNPLYAFLGKRPGEALDCIYCRDSENGCGTTPNCLFCGTAVAIHQSSRKPGVLMENDCRLMTGKEKTAHDYRVRVKRTTLDGRPYTLLLVKDISHENRRKTLERTFFHDILNTAGSIRSLASIMKDAPVEELDPYFDMAKSCTDVLVEEIKAQIDLLAAEQGQLATAYSQVNAGTLLRTVSSLYLNHPVAGNKRLQISGTAGTLNLRTDPRLLTRILGNMVKNALEAETSNTRITMGADPADTPSGPGIEFWVHNPSPMEEPVRHQIFHRTFSTKGNDRGLGTYSARLLGENYLKGEVSFSSSPEQGTRFFIRLPLDP